MSAGGELRSDFRALWRDGWAHIHRARWLLLALALAAAGATLLLWPHDLPLSQAFTADRPREWKRFARALRAWGSFIDTPVLCGLLWAAGHALRNAAWRRAALAALLAASLAGLSINVLRFATGRTRPNTGRNEFTGPTLDYKRQSFPSGHVGTSAGCAAALLAAVPPYGTAAAISAGGVAWASLYNRNHYLSDIGVAILFGLAFGLPFGMAARRSSAAPRA